MSDNVPQVAPRGWLTRTQIKDRIPERARLAVRSRLDRQTIERRRKPPIWGNLRRQGGFAPPYAEGRGTPVDRYYVERFLTDHRHDITGHAVEVHDTGYIDRFGHDILMKDAIDIRTDNPRATIVADLCQANSLPAATFDCAVVTQTLHLVPDATTAMANLYRALKPGGTLLLTAPVTSPLAIDLPTDAWRFTPLGLQHLAEGCTAAGDEIVVSAHGNRISSVAFLLGLAIEDLRNDDLEPNDALCPLIAALRLTRTC